MCNQKSIRTRSMPACLGLAAAIALGCGIQPGHAADGQPQLTAVASTEAQTPPRHFAKITTLDGKTYQEVTVQKIQPDGLLVEFSLAGGGFGTAKLKFRNLPEGVREPYRYDALQAAAFEASQAEGEKAWNARNEAWAERRQAAMDAQMVREERLRDQVRAEEAARQTAAEARAEEQRQTPPAPYPYGYGYGLGWGTGWNTPHHHVPHLVVPPTPTPPVSPFMGPMRPLGK
ncbi:MAG: hypothetical protein JWM16_2413 [Verrucomicrobiales bacterium]|nr:hypothetical protein [Verrucomicrobiales bacterium]